MKDRPYFLAPTIRPTFMTAMILTLFAILCAFCAPVPAQTVDPTNPCGVAVPPGVPAIYSDVTKISCSPMPSASSTGLSIRTNAAGVMAYHHCKVAGVWRPEWVAATWAFIASTPKASDAAAILTSADPVTTANAIAQDYPHIPLSDPSLAPVWCPFQAEMYAATPAADLPPYVVAPNGGQKTRPAMSLVNGKLVFSSTLKATVGAPCDMSVTITAGTLIYGQTAPGVMAVCVKSGT